MQIEPMLTTRKIRLSPAMRALVAERTRKLERFYRRLTRCEVVVEGPGTRRRNGGPFDVRIVLTVPGAELTVSHKASEELEAGLREAFDAARRQLEDFARRQRGEVKTHDTTAAAAPPAG